MTEELRNKIHKELEWTFADKEISEKTFLFLIKGGKRCSIFYMLPKIHKNKFPPSGRPIVSSINSPTEKISMLLDIILQPFVLKTRSHIRDMGDFLSKVQGLELSPNDWMFSMDVTSLYTNIPHDDGIECIKKVLSQKTNSTPKNSSLIKLLEFVLKSNNFMFNQYNHLQINGMAMGTQVAPTCANLFVDSLEQKFIYPHPKCSRIWFRFIDDIWGIFCSTEEELNSFVEFCNSFHDTIKFMVEYSKKLITFLDVTMYQEDNRIKSTLYVKPTDSHSYLDYSSCHPQTIKSSIPYSQFLRMRRNCTEWTEFVKHSVQLLSYLSLREYPPMLTIAGLH